MVWYNSMMDDTGKIMYFHNVSLDGFSSKVLL